MNLEKFGNGHLDLEEIDLSTATPDEKADYFGIRLGCPIVLSMKTERGADVMAQRYAQLLAFYGLILEEVGKVRPDIATKIKGPVDRLPGEPLAVFDPEWISEENRKILVGPETPVGSALPRLITYYIFDFKTSVTPADRMSRALDYFDATLRDLLPYEGPNTLLVNFAEKLAVFGGADPNAILRHTLSAGKLKQDSFFTYFREIGNEMKRNAPVLWDAYNALNPAQRAEFKIATLPA